MTQREAQGTLTDQVGLMPERRVRQPRLPAPRMPASNSAMESLPDESQTTNRMNQLLSGNVPKLSPAQVESYLQANGRNAGSLMAAFRAIDDLAFLREAKEKFPNDPLVAFDAIFRSQNSEERRQWLDHLKRSAPENSLGNYLSALDFFKSGQSDQAVQELLNATKKPKFQEYMGDFIQNSEEAYRAAGYSVAESKAASGYSVQLPQLGQFKDLGRRVGDLANLYRQAGDESSAQATMQFGVTLAQRLSEASSPKVIITELVGQAIERQFLESMNPALPYDNAGRTVKDRLDELTQSRNAIKDLAKQGQRLVEMLPEQDLISYFDRIKVAGEREALRWIMERHGKP